MNQMVIEIYEIIPTDCIDNDELPPEARMMSFIIEVTNIRHYDDYDTVHWANKFMEYVPSLGFVTEDWDYKE